MKMELDSISNGTTADLVSYNHFARDSTQYRHIFFHTVITHRKIVFYTTLATGLFWAIYHYLFLKDKFEALN